MGANDYLEFSDDWSEVVPQLLTLLWARRQAESGEIGREALETNDAVTFVKRVEELLKLKSTDVQAVAATDDGGTTVVEGGLTIRIRTGKKIIKESTNVANYKREELAFSGGEDQAKTFAGLLRMLDALDQMCFHHQYSKASALLLMRENLGGQAKELISSAVTLENAIQTLLARYAREAIVTRACSFPAPDIAERIGDFVCLRGSSQEAVPSSRGDAAVASDLFDGAGESATRLESRESAPVGQD